MQAAKRRLDSADVMVKGPEGGLRWRPLHAALVGRRCSMATLLGKLYAVGPQTGELTSIMLTAEPYCSCQLWWCCVTCVLLGQLHAHAKSQFAPASSAKRVLLVDTARPCTKQSGSCLWPWVPGQQGPLRPLLTVCTSSNTSTSQSIISGCAILMCCVAVAGCQALFCDYT